MNTVRKDRSAAASRRGVRWLMILSVGASACSSGPSPATGPTVGADTAVDPGRLEEMLFDFAADSMMGRTAGTEGHQKATRYIADRAQSFGLQPAGEEGGFFQDVPLVSRAAFSTLTLEDGAVEIGNDFAPLVIDDFNSPPALDFTGIGVIYGGDMGAPTEISAEAAEGKVVVLGAASGPNGRAFGLVGATLEKLSGARALLMASTDYADADIMDFLLEPQTILDEGDDSASEADGAFIAFVSEAFVERVFGAGVGVLATGTEGPTIAGAVGIRDEPTPAPSSNVIAMVRGSDPELQDQYVVISAHSDHIAPQIPAVEHAAHRAYLEVVRPTGAEAPARDATPAEEIRIQDIVSRTNGAGARLDSISNGADDDGSGSMALLEIGRVMASAAVKPKRSILFVWHTGEEAGLLGAQHFTDNPTVPLESMVADINLDMIGRGRDDDLEDGGAGYLQLIGSRRLSTELGDMVESVNTTGGHGFEFDYQYDADGHPSNFYCRSDHYMYARYGIPIVFMSTGSHRDYHMVTDEPQYIDYGKLGRVTNFVRDLAGQVADLDHRVVVDGPIPDPTQPCQQ